MILRKTPLLSVIAALAMMLAFSFNQIAVAQTPGTPVTQTGGRYDAGQVVYSMTQAINGAQGTITVPALSGQCFYVDSLVVHAGSDATGQTGAVAFTTTNLGGTTTTETGVASSIGFVFYFSVGVTINGSTQQLIGTTPMRASNCGLAVTALTPAQTAHVASSILLIGHYAAF